MLFTGGPDNPNPIFLAMALCIVIVAGNFTSGVFEVGSRNEPREVNARSKLQAAESPVAESSAAVQNSEELASVVEIPITCYQILGVPERADKDEVIKAAMVLKNAEIEDGYTSEAIVSRQELLLDVRDKILFVPEYAGKLREKIPPKSSLCIPWSWLPAALCLLQEIGEGKLVLEIGRAAIQLPPAKPYVHDLLLSMALAECTIAKLSFERNKVSEGVEALACAQYFLKSKVSLEKIPLLSQIEEALEKLAPACTLELPGVLHTPNNAESRRGAISALTELLRRGLYIESSCRVQDWPCFLSQTLTELMALEMVDLISFCDILAIARKSKKSLESRNQMTVIDSGCFYTAMIARTALGFSSRQTDLVNKAKTICGRLIASEGVDLKFEGAFCSLLIGQGSKRVALKKLGQVEVNGRAKVRKCESNIPNKEAKDKGTRNQLLKMWLMDVVHCVFPDTQTCCSCLVESERHLRGIYQHKINSKHVGKVARQLAASVHLLKDLWLSVKGIWNKGLKVPGEIVGAILIGYCIFKLFPKRREPLSLESEVFRAPGRKGRALICPLVDKRILGPYGDLVAVFRPSPKHQTSAKRAEETWLTEDILTETCESLITGTLLYKKHMPLGETEPIVKQWLKDKAKKLWPSHKIQTQDAMICDHPYLCIDVSNKDTCLCDISQFIESIRQFLTAKCYNPNEEDAEKRVAVLTLETGSYDLLLHLDKSHLIVLRFRLNDVYLLGYAVFEEVQGCYQWYEFKHDEHLISESKFLEFNGSYTALESQANISLEDLKYGYDQLRGLIYDLKKDNMKQRKEASDVDRKARNLIRLIVLFAESLRFDCISKKIIDGFLSDNCQLGSKDKDILTSWDKISTAVLRGDSAVCIKNSTFTLDEMKRMLHLCKPGAESGADEKEKGRRNVGRSTQGKRK